MYSTCSLTREQNEGFVVLLLLLLLLRTHSSKSSHLPLCFTLHHHQMWCLASWPNWRNPRKRSWRTVCSASGKATPFAGCAPTLARRQDLQLTKEKARRKKRRRRRRRSHAWRGRCPAQFALTRCARSAGVSLCAGCERVSSEQGVLVFAFFRKRERERERRRDGLLLFVARGAQDPAVHGAGQARE